MVELSTNNMDDVILSDWFLEQAAKTPDAIAVVDGKVEMTYRELDEMTNRLAVQLVEDYGVGPDQVVGILCVEIAGIAFLARLGRLPTST